MTGLGIDLGTTFFKGAVLDRDGLRAIRRFPSPQPIIGPPGACQLDPEAVIATTRTLIRALLSDAPDATDLFITGQMHGLVFTDEQGRPISNIWTWRDRQANLDALRYIPTVEDRRRIGNEWRVGVPVTILTWLAEKEMLPVGVYPTSLLDFVVANLCGSTPMTDPTNASAHGLFDIDRSTWHHELMSRCGLSGLKWPRIVATGESVGVMTTDGHRLTIHAPIGDQQCALLGTGFAEGELSLNISTGSQASVLSTAPLVGPFQVRPYFGGLWLNTFVGIPAGRALAVLVELLTELGRPDDDVWDRISEAVGKVGSTDLRVDLSFFGAGGSITNATADNFTVGHLFLAAFANMASNYSHCARELGGWERVVFSGGLAQRFSELRDVILRTLGFPDWRSADSAEDTLLGLQRLSVEPLSVDATRDMNGNNP